MNFYPLAGERGTFVLFMCVDIAPELRAYTVEPHCLGIQTTRGHVYTGGLSLQRDFTPRLTPGGELYGGISDNKGLSKDQLRALVVVPTPPVKISV
jgi:hypothetical protein